jgi:hypothetical protein
MKRILTALLSVFLCLEIHGQAMQSINYSAIIHDKDGKPLLSKPVTLRLSVLTGNAFDSISYSEYHKVFTDQYGLASCIIGKGEALSGSFSTIEWEKKSFLKVEADIDDGRGFIDMGTTEIVTVNTTASANSKKSGNSITEDKIFISRKFVGTFIDYRHTGPESYNGPNLIWIKTSLENIYGKISAYGKKCKFSPGDKLYIRRSNFVPGGISGYWIYQIENDSSVYYKVTDFQHDSKVDVETWFK